MKISSDYSYNSYSAPYNRRKPVFAAHPDFVELSSHFNIKASRYFRRGGYYGFPSGEFADVIGTLRKYFVNNPFDEKVKMLIGGVADSQEPFSMLAVIKNMIGRKKLDDVLDLYIVDLQSPPSGYKLYMDSFYDYKGLPKFAQSSFVREPFTKSQFHYRVKGEILDYLASVYANPEKAKWDSRLQEKVHDFKDESLDIVSVNNTLTYIKSTNTIIDTVKKIIDLLKQGGAFITDPDISYNKAMESGVDEIYRGIYRKKNPNKPSEFMQNFFVSKNPLNAD